MSFNTVCDFLCNVEVFYFYAISLFYFYFCCLSFWCCSQKCLPRIMPRSFSSSRFMVFRFLVLTLKCLTILSWVFYIVWDSNLILLQMYSLFFKHHLLKKLSFPHCVFWHPCWRSIVHRCVDLFLGSIHWSICLFLCLYHTVSFIIAL